MASSAPTDFVPETFIFSHYTDEQLYTLLDYYNELLQESRDLYKHACECHDATHQHKEQSDYIQFEHNIHSIYEEQRDRNNYYVYCCEQYGSEEADEIEKRRNQFLERLQTLKNRYAKTFELTDKKTWELLCKNERKPAEDADKYPLCVACKSGDANIDAHMVLGGCAQHYEPRLIRRSTCAGCLDEQPNQMAHMGLGGCLETEEDMY